jgi:cytochrome c oxidase subunit 2
MLRKNAWKGSTTTAVALALFLLILTGVTVYLFIAKTWWFPEAINQMGREIDAQFMRTLWITGVVFVLSQLALGWAVFRYRSRGQRATYNHGNNLMEIVWTAATAVVFIGLGLYGQAVWAGLHITGAPQGALQIEITGQQFAWNIRYPGADGKFGATSPTLMSDSGGNPVGIDPNDPAGQDDLVLPVMAVPVNRDVELILRSKDVTHSFFVRELRLKQDLVPGMIIRVHFKAEQVGRYEIACAELCGLGHQRMRSFLQVMSAEDYEKWLRDQAEQDQE